MHKKIALFSLVIILLLINWSIASKEQHLAEGQIVYLDLAPVDPRSLMQGDYMALRFRLANSIHNALPKTEEKGRWRHNIAASDGYVVITLDDKRIATFKALYNEQSLSDDEMLLRYRIRNGSVKFATNAFFFEEGHGKYYENARFGQFRVDAQGELLLAGMYGEALNKLPEKE